MHLSDRNVHCNSRGEVDLDNFIKFKELVEVRGNFILASRVGESELETLGGWVHWGKRGGSLLLLICIHWGMCSCRGFPLERLVGGVLGSN